MSLLAFATAEDGLKDIVISGTVEQSSTYARTGTYSYRMPYGSGLGSHALSLPFPEKNTLYAQFATTRTAGGATPVAGSKWVAWRKGGVVLGCLSFETAANQTLTAWIGDRVTSIGTIAPCLADAPTFVLFEFFIVIDDTNGIVQIKVNGNLVIDYSGDTKPGADDTLDNFAIGTNINNISYHTYIDDFAVADNQGSDFNSWLNGLKFHRLAPNGAGNYSQWTPSSGNNYECVDETPVDTGDFVSTDQSGYRDSYAMADCPGGLSGILGVAGVYYGQGGEQIKRLIRLGGVDYLGDALTLPGPCGKVFDVMAANPATSAAWQESAINGCELGMERV